MSSYDKYAAIRDSKGLTDYRVGKDSGVGTATLSNWKNGKYVPKIENLMKIADYLGISIDEISEPKKKNIIHVYHAVNASDGGKSHPGRHSTPNELKSIFQNSSSLRVSFQIPVLGRVTAGIPIEAVEDIIDYEEITEAMARDGEYFALQIKGDSMEPRMTDGDVVIVRKQNNAGDGDIVIATVNGDDATCKVLKKYENGDVALLSLNPSYQPFYFSKQEVKDTPIQIWGKVKELRAKF